MSRCVRYAVVMLFSLVWNPAYALEQAGHDQGPQQHDIPYGVIDPDLIATAYAGDEIFRYDISYTGGFKLGELYLKLQKSKDTVDAFFIKARVTTDNGMFSALYPIEDVHVTKVVGPQRLPVHYEVWQKEGRNYQAHRVVIYNQKYGKVFYRLNDNPLKIFEVGASVQNEFSSFFASRIMELTPGHPFIVPTFADDTRNEVVVMVRELEKMKETILGTVATVVVEPIMTFSGLYDKRGDTIIWYTDDICRVPVQVNSKLLIGSLTARLVAYNNPACPRYDGAVLDKYRDDVSWMAKF